MPLSADQQRFAQQLRTTHKDYESELLWHRFLLDAYASTGGFAGRVRLPFSAFWGSGAEDYGSPLSTTTQGDLDDGESRIDTYLERFPREDVRKFARRVAVSQFPNYCEPIVDLRHSYLNRKPMSYAGVEALKDGDEPWWKNAGAGLTWDELMASVVRLRALVLGWFPMLVDAPPVAPGLSIAQARDAGLRARCIPLYPSNLLDWRHDEQSGELLWAMIRTCYSRKASPFDPELSVERFSFWTPTTVSTFEIITDEKGSEELAPIQPSVAHGFGQVPIVIFRAKPTPNDRVRGMSIIGSVAQLNRKLFNYLSEFDEHLRSSVFAFLQVPVTDASKSGTVIAGNANALPIDMRSTRDFKYISPDASVASTFEARVSKQIDEIHRIGRNESGGSKQVAKSGVAQAYDFEGMNRAISDNASALAMAEQQTLRLVSRIEQPEQDEDEIRVTAASKFDVEEMAKDLEEALTAIDLKLGITATSRIKQRLVRKLLPNLSDEELTTIDSEIEDEAEAEVREAAAMSEMLAQDPTQEPDTNEADPSADPKTSARAPAEGTPRPGERSQRPGSPKARGARKG